MQKKLLAIFLSLVLAASTLASCAPADDADNGGANESEAEVTVGEDGREMVGNMYVEGLPVLEETKTYTIVAQNYDASQLKIAEKAAAIFAEEQTNIDIEWTEIGNSAWADRVNIMLAGGDLPDAFALGGVDVMTNTEQLVVLNDYIEKYGPNIQKIFEDSPEIEAALTTPDGNIYSLPSGRQEDIVLIDLIAWINMEWLNSADMEMPTTIDEFEAACKYFFENDMNGNGNPNDEIPVGSQDVASVYETFMPAFGTSGYTYYVKDGEVRLSAQDEGYYDALQWLSEMYKAGYIDQELYTQADTWASKGTAATDTIYGTIINYNCLEFNRNLYNPNNGQYDNLQILSSEFEANPQFTPTEQPPGDMTAFTITTACEDPEVLVRYYDFCNSSIEMKLMWQKGDPNADVTETSAIWADEENEVWIETFEGAGDFPNPAIFAQTFGMGSLGISYFTADELNRTMQLHEDKQVRMDAINEYSDAGAISEEPYIKSFADYDTENEKSILENDISTYVTTFTANAVANGITETEWEEHLNTLESLKVDEYLQILNDGYSRMSEVLE